jgi:ferredoxin--NADP+ reductase
MAINQETVTGIQQHTDRLFTFQTTRNSGFKFDNGQFTMIGLDVNGKKILRAYSIASANHQEHLNFISINVPNGPLTSVLQHIQIGDIIEVSTKAVGTLTIDRLSTADELFLLATGTGLAPFMSIIADPATYDKFKTVTVVHCCRTTAELVYADYIKNLHQDELLGEIVQGKLFYHPRTTEQHSENFGRIITKDGVADWIHNLLTPLDKQFCRVMICGNPNMLAELTAYFTSNKWTMGSINAPGEFIIEKAFVEAK